VVREPWASRVTGLSRARISAEERNPARAGGIIGCGQGSSPLDRPEVVRSSLATETSHPGVFAFTCYYRRECCLSSIRSDNWANGRFFAKATVGARVAVTGGAFVFLVVHRGVHAIGPLYRRADIAEIMSTASRLCECTKAYFP
jgi:hypothetical protein